ELIGITIARPLVNFGKCVQGFSKTNILNVANRGDAILVISNLVIDGVPAPSEGFRILHTLPIVLPVNGSINLSIVADNPTIGTNSLIMDIVSDGALQSLPVELRSVVVPPPNVVVFNTDPPGMLLQ